MEQGKVCNTLEYWRYYRELSARDQDRVKMLILLLSGRGEEADMDTWLALDEADNDTLAA